MLIYKQDYFGFVYLWWDALRKKFYIGSHMGSFDDGYVSSSKRLNNCHKKRKNDLSRIIIETVDNSDREYLYKREQYWLDCIDDSYMGGFSYNIRKCAKGFDSTQSIKINNQRVANGSHVFLGPAVNKKRMDSGNHHFLDKDFQQKIAALSKSRVEDGTHNFLGGEIQGITSRRRVANGTHNFLDSEKQRETSNKLVREGRHHFLGGAIQSKNTQMRLALGTHPFQNQPIRTCPHCELTSRGHNMIRYHFDNCKLKP
jgi:uncharacterized protein YlaI